RAAAALHPQEEAGIRPLSTRARMPGGASRPSVRRVSPPTGGSAVMRWVLGSGLRFWRLVLALAIGVMVFGIAQLKSAPVDVYPEFTPPAVQIQTEALGLSAAEVEQLITVPLEQDLLNGVPWLDRIHSSSMPGLSAIDLTFQPGTNLYAARQMVQERM